MLFLVLCLCACVLTVSGQVNNFDLQSMPKYDSRYDYLDVDMLFNSKRLVHNYVECLHSGLRCTPEGKALKRLLPEALRTKCVRCTDRQKKIAVKIIRRLKNEYPEDWAKLASKWDPTGDFTRYFEMFLANEVFNTIPHNNGNELPPPTFSPPQRIPFTGPPAPPSTVATVMPTATIRPIFLNRFGDEGELMTGDTSMPMATTPRPPPTTTRVTFATKSVPRPTAVSWDTAASNTMPTLLTQEPTNDLPFAITTAMTIIDRIGLKIIRTTELFTDILKNTVRAVVGR